MTNTAHKTRTLVELADQPTAPSLGGLRPYSSVRWQPMRAVMHAQDTVIAATRRIVAEWSTSGADDWSVPSGSTDPSGGGQAYPLDTWRVVATLEGRVTPGSELHSYCVACPSGLTEKLVGSNYVSDGPWGEIRVGVTWSNGASSTGPHYSSAHLVGSSAGPYGGLEPSEPGQAWSWAMLVEIGQHRPPGYLLTASVRATYSEWSDVEITIEVRGGARVEHAVVHEYPRAHTTDHNDDGLTSAHAALPSTAPLTFAPQIKAHDGATYEEHRFGTRRIAQVASRQAERLGPRVVSWSCWDETDASIWNQAEGNPVTTTSATFVELLDTTITTYSSSNPGWIVGSAYAQLHRLCDPTCIARSRFAAVPVRVTVDASRSAGDGVVRVQAGSYDWVDVPITGARGLYTITGYVEGQAAGDHSSPPVSVFVRVASGTLSVYGISVDFGAW